MDDRPTADWRGLDGSLEGIRVVDLTRNLAGPYCTQILGDLGADVVKIEQPGTGDDTRAWAPPLWDGVSATFLAANRNKRSVAVNLDTDGGCDVVRDLVAGADVLVESFRPGSLDRRGLGWEALSAHNPGLVYCSISAYGPTGPRRDEPGYDPVVQAYSGIMSMTGEPDGPPVRLGIGALDLGAGLWATIGILSALAERRRDGRGRLLTTSLFEVATWWLSYHLAGYLGSGHPPARQGTTASFIAPYEVFPTAEGDLMVAAPNDNLFRALLGVLDLPALADDPRFRTNGARVAHRAELRALLVARLATRTATEWEAGLRAASIPCSPVRSVADLADDAQLDALGLMVRQPHPQVADLRLVGLPVAERSADGLRRGATRLAPPLLGEHTAEVLAELGYDDASLAALGDAGAVSFAGTSRPSVSELP